MENSEEAFNVDDAEIFEDFIEDGQISPEEDLLKLLSEADEDEFKERFERNINTLKNQAGEIDDKYIHILDELKISIELLKLFRLKNEYFRDVLFRAYRAFEFLLNDSVLNRYQVDFEILETLNWGTKQRLLYKKIGNQLRSIGYIKNPIENIRKNRNSIIHGILDHRNLMNSIDDVFQELRNVIDTITNILPIIEQTTPE